MKSLSIFFNSDKIYAGMFERNTKGLSLLDISATLDPLDLEDIENEISQKSINQLKRNLGNSEHKVEELNVILNNENSYWTVIPGDLNMDREELKNLLDFEIKNNLGSFDINNFLFRIYPYGRKDENDSSMLLAIFINKNIVQNISKVLDFTGLEINYLTIAQISSQNTIEYNYPDTSHLYDLLINVEDTFCDISLSNNNLTYHYDLVKLDPNKSIESLISDEITKLKQNGLSPGNILAIGNKLKKEFINDLNEVLDLNAKRLNSFRFVRADIDQRLKDYCIRTSHIYAPVVGGALNSFDRGKIIEF